MKDLKEQIKKEDRDLFLAKTVYKKGYWLVWYTGFFLTSLKKQIGIGGVNDIQVVLEDDKGSRLGDAICHYGSYGVKDGLWETMINGEDDVTGYLTWKQVEKKFDNLINSLKDTHE